VAMSMMATRWVYRKHGTFSVITQTNADDISQNIPKFGQYGNFNL